MYGTQGKDPTEARAVLAQDVLFGMNLLTLTGFVVMGLTVTLMAAGTALVFLGLYAGNWSG